MNLRIGVDVGGTFTDLIVSDEATGTVVVGKELTTPEAPERGVLAAVDGTLSDGLTGARDFVHGTTVGLNALLERRGAVVGLLATKGFRDVLEIRRGDRDDPYDLFWSGPAPLVPRSLRQPIGGRIKADGTEHEPLSHGDVKAAAEAFAAAGVDAVAIAFMNAYANPAHEQEAERLLREHGFTGEISASHRVSGEYREYERTSTTVIDAFVRRRMGGYLERLRDSLGERGFGGRSFVTRSGGGAMAFDEAMDRPFETIISGPVAGVAAVATLAKELGLDEVIAADVGGTSFDTCLVVDGVPPVLYEGEIIGLPVQTPWVDVRSIGAGGGSIAHVDAGRLLRVGPRSAGSRPGPACYGRGGTEPTTTDAMLVLGMLPAGDIAGSVSLDLAKATAAYAPLVEQLRFETVEEVARGVVQIAANHMAEAIRSITVEQGRDPRTGAIVAFGGAGALFGTLLADELGASTVVVPVHAGAFSAYGLLGVDLARTASRTRLTPLTPEGLRAARPLVQELLDSIDARTDAAAGRQLAVHLDVRYVGQEHTLTITAPAAAGELLTDDALTVADLFTSQYARVFGATIEEAIEVVTYRLVATTPLERGEATPAKPAADGTGSSTTTAWSFTRGERTEFAVVDRAAIAPGDSVSGPAIVREPTTTTYLDAGWTAHVHDTGHLILERRDRA